jgi:hypothetical protein
VIHVRASHGFHARPCGHWDERCNILLAQNGRSGTSLSTAITLAAQGTAAALPAQVPPQIFQVHYFGLIRKGRAAQPAKLNDRTDRRLANNYIVVPLAPSLMFIPIPDRLAAEAYELPPCRQAQFPRRRFWTVVISSGSLLDAKAGAQSQL